MSDYQIVIALEELDEYGDPGMDFIDSVVLPSSASSSEVMAAVQTLRSRTSKKVAYDAGRRCDNCGAKSPPFWPRKRGKDGDLLCDACFGKEARLSYYEGDREARKVAHDSPGTDILRHCPFCGAGQLTGRSDGTVECGFCDATFTVQTQPNLPSTPQTVGDDLYMHPEMSEPGVPEDEINPEEPEETVLPLTEEESGNDMEDGDNPFDDIEKMTFRIGGATVPSSEYIKHLALKYADDRGAVLREIRSASRK